MRCQIVDLNGKDARGDGEMKFLPWACHPEGNFAYIAGDQGFQSVSSASQLFCKLMTKIPQYQFISLPTL